MANSSTQLYASQGNGGKATVTVGELSGALTIPDATASVVGGVLKAATVAAITDSTGGTPSATLAAIAAGAAYTQADMVAVKNAIASLAADYNALRTSLRNAGTVA